MGSKSEQNGEFPDDSHLFPNVAKLIRIQLRKLQFRRSSKSRNSSPAKDEVSSKERQTSEGSSFSFLNDKRVYAASSSRSPYESTEDSLVDPIDPTPYTPHNNRTSLGLFLLHQPLRTAPVDIIFVHGLGGNSSLTWSKDHDLAMFWPKLWLPSEPHVRDTRIFSFGYNANFHPGSSKSISNIGDFAKELLYEMKYGRYPNGEAFGLGRVPIVFVAHSMGGLVVKKAYLLGQNDGAYQDIVRSMASVLFLATPHRGTDLAEILNRMLSATFRFPKKFIQELSRSSQTLEELNEQFRHVAPRLLIHSFYELRPTSVGPVKLMILERQSSILGYGEEISRPLEADHHEVCKYSSMDDPNYIAVRNALMAIVQDLRIRGTHAITHRQAEQSKAIQVLLGSGSSMEDDYQYQRKQWVPGTCDWIFDDPKVKGWLDHSTHGSRVLWYNAPPGTGKSVLSGHLIHHLRQSGELCQFFFFKAGDQTRGSPGVALRAIARQLSDSVPEFRTILIDASRDGHHFDHSDPSVLWREIFEGVLFQLKLERPLFWIFDAVDESDSSKALLGYLKGITNSLTPIHVLLVSRKTDALSRAIQSASGALDVDILEKTYREQNHQDIQHLIAQTLKEMHGSDKLKDYLRRTLSARAEGSFLWVRLVLEEIQGCHTEEAIREALEEIPDDMNLMYNHMEQKLLQKRRQADIRLCKTLLRYIVCAQRRLSLDELAQLLQSEYAGILDLRRTIHDLCGQFILIDDLNHVSILHQTARDFLTLVSTSEIRVSLSEGNSALFQKCMVILCDPSLRATISQTQNTEQNRSRVDLYASNAWIYHLEESGKPSDINFDHLIQFFKCSAVLTWIHSLALEGRIGILIKASKALTKFAGKTRKLYQSQSPLLHRLTDLELLDKWSVDLIKIVGKFSSHLSAEPSAIYKIIPPLCPEDSAIRQQFNERESADLVISGVQNQAWSDNLAKWTLPQDHQAWKITCTQDLIAVLTSRRCVFIWNSHNFAEVCVLRQDESIIDICLNKRGTLLLTYGLQTTRLWSLPSGSMSSSVQSPPQVKVMTMMFCKNDSTVVSGSDDRTIRTIDVPDFSTGWQELNSSLLHESHELEGAIVNSPMCMAFNGDGTQIGVSYRGFPLSAWSLLDGKCIRRCSRAQFRQDRHRPSDNWFAVDRFTWNPVSGHIIGIYKDGCVFKWHPVTNENREAKSTADEVAASSDGKLFVTSSSSGTLRIWNFSFFTPIYQLSSEDLVTGLTFSPDHLRFYDVRGSEINAWEPNSLFRFAGTEDQSSDAASEEQPSISASHISEANLTRYEAVSALAASPTGLLYCHGNEEGRIELCDPLTNESTQLAMFHNMLSVSHLEWNDVGDTVAAADLAGDLVINRIFRDSGPFSIQQVSKPTLDLDDRGIHQILLNHDATRLLVATDDLCHLISTIDSKIITSTTLQDGQSYQWTRHPTRPELFLAFGGRRIKCFHWNDFTETAHYPDWVLQTQSNDEPSLPFTEEKSEDAPLQAKIEPAGYTTTRAMLCQDGKHVLVHIKRTNSHGQSSKHLFVANTKAFDSDAPLATLHIPFEVASAVEHPLGILAGPTLVFLDRDLWICSYRLGSSMETHRRHFFVPRDWMSSEGISQCNLLPDGTLLCPKDDRVALIRGPLENAGF
jgi:WD40 repeat protein/pimeloyl-ACP methyl ester carboxylesterase